LNFEFDFPVGPLPPALEELFVQNPKYQHLASSFPLPRSLKRLLIRLNGHPLVLPPALEDLVLLSGEYHHPMPQLPPTLKLLELTGFARPFGAAPALEMLDVCVWEEEDLESFQPLGPLPSTLKHLILPRGFPFPLENAPAGLVVTRR
jgi:hypothetical protein